MKEIDARGLTCPIPVVNTKKALEEYPQENEFTVLVDNDAARQNVMKFARQKGCDVKDSQPDEKCFQLVITRNADGQQEEEIPIECPIETKTAQGKRMVVFSSNQMGNGDEVLGKTLMKAFVFALTKQDDLPDQILLYNSGAFLTCEDSDSLEDFKYMEEEGVEIFTCGTCLDFYDLTKKLAVGSITNMYDIVRMMEQADRIIRP